MKLKQQSDTIYRHLLLWKLVTIRICNYGNTHLRRKDWMFLKCFHCCHHR